MHVTWTVFTNARSEKAAHKVYQRLIQRLGCEPVQMTIEPYWKTGGHLLHFAIKLASATWNDQVVEAIALGQRAGYGWTLSGEVSRDLSSWSNEPSVSGIEAMEWNLREPPQDDREQTEPTEAVRDTVGD